MHSSPDQHLERAIELATESASTDGGPFGAVVVTENGTVYEGHNTVVASHDPSAHAEVNAIRAACAGEATHDLAGAVLYASTQPCPMCAAAIYWAGIARVEYAATAQQAAAAGFSDVDIAEYLKGTLDSPVPFTHQGHSLSDAPFTAFENNPNAVEY
ncbi:nucleoside deaminase [Corynebacterium appendicis]|uniref:nucleoside deaminase n=1 Tax=Corynebacterium appendicis TaxID=163202 RepID=UPI0023574AE2|nr:nucleoside deaminase [Corynebacterium appendicis]